MNLTVFFTRTALHVMSMRELLQFVNVKLCTEFNKFLIGQGGGAWNQNSRLEYEPAWVNAEVV